MQIVLVQIKPVFPGDAVADGITGMGVQDHFGMAYRTGGEINQAGIIAARFGAVIFGGCLVDDLVVVRPALAFSEASIEFN